MDELEKINRRTERVRKAIEEERRVVEAYERLRKAEGELAELRKRRKQFEDERDPLLKLLHTLTSILTKRPEGRKK